MKSKERNPDISAREEPAAVWHPVSRLRGWEKNPRKNAKAVDKVVESIRRFGWGAPILAREADGEVIAGHTRLLAAKKLGLEKVPVRFLDLDPADAHLLALADNKLSEIAEWDAEAVSSILSAYGKEDVELAGWDSVELDKLAAEIVGEPDQESSAKEIDVDSFAFGCKCPRCGFEFDPKSKLRMESFGTFGAISADSRDDHVCLWRWVKHGLQTCRMRCCCGQRY